MTAPAGDTPFAPGYSHPEGKRNGATLEPNRDSALSRTLVSGGTITTPKSGGESAPPSFTPPRRRASHGSRHLCEDAGWTEEELRPTSQVLGSGRRTRPMAPLAAAIPGHARTPTKNRPATAADPPDRLRRETVLRMTPERPTRAAG